MMVCVGCAYDGVRVLTHNPLAHAENGVPLPQPPERIPEPPAASERPIRSRYSELLGALSTWVDQASIGDNGERPYFSLNRTSGDGWDASAFSFYDGCATAEAADPLQALQACLKHLLEAPNREREAQRDTAVRAVAFALRVSHDEARQRMRAIPGWSA